MGAIEPPFFCHVSLNKKIVLLVDISLYMFGQWPMFLSVRTGHNSTGVSDMARVVRDDVTGPITYHREPTQSEINFGYGCTHYMDFEISECCKKGTRILKQWVKGPDGLRYTR
jgi:hypothetical protein